MINEFLLAGDFPQGMVNNVTDQRLLTVKMLVDASFTDPEACCQMVHSKCNTSRAQFFPRCRYNPLPDGCIQITHKTTPYCSEHRQV